MLTVSSAVMLTVSSAVMLTVSSAVCLQVVVHEQGKRTEADAGSFGVTGSLLLLLLAITKFDPFSAL